MGVVYPPAGRRRHHPLHIAGIRHAVGSSEEKQIVIHLRSLRWVGMSDPHYKHTDDAQELLGAATPQRDLHLVHLAIIVQRQ